MVAAFHKQTTAYDTKHHRHSVNSDRKLKATAKGKAKGDTAEITDAADPDRNGRYFVKSVVTTCGAAA